MHSHRESCEDLITHLYIHCAELPKLPHLASALRVKSLEKEYSYGMLLEMTSPEYDAGTRDRRSSSITPTSAWLSLNGLQQYRAEPVYLHRLHTFLPSCVQDRM